MVGAATLLEACWHQTPALDLSGTSHVTIDYEKLLRVGYGGLRAQLRARRARAGLAAGQADYLSAMLTCLDAAHVWQQRHVAALEELCPTLEGEQRGIIEELLPVIQRVAEAPPTTFYEALQSLWFAWTFQRLCGNWTGLGRSISCSAHSSTAIWMPGG